MNNKEEIIDQLLGLYSYWEECYNQYLPSLLEKFGEHKDVGQYVARSLKLEHDKVKNKIEEALGEIAKNNSNGTEINLLLGNITASMSEIQESFSGNGIKKLIIKYYYQCS